MGELRRRAKVELRIFSDEELLSAKKALQERIWVIVIQAAVDQVRRQRRLLARDYVPTGLTAKTIHDQIVREYLASRKLLPPPSFPTPRFNPPVACGAVYEALAYMSWFGPLEERDVNFEEARRRGLKHPAREIWVQKRWVIGVLEEAEKSVAWEEGVRCFFLSPALAEDFILKKGPRGDGRRRNFGFRAFDFPRLRGTGGC